MSENLKSRLLAILTRLVVEDGDLEPAAALDEMLAAMRAGIENHDLTEGLVPVTRDRSTAVIAWEHIIDKISQQEAAPTGEFAGSPDTIGELRARRSQRPDDWRPRDVLVRLLRQIDAGEIAPTQMVVIWTWPKDGESDDTDSNAIAYAQSTKGPRDQIALLEIAKVHMIAAG